MPILNQWQITLTVDEVLHAQGAEPEAILARRPSFGKVTEEAIALGVPLLTPQVLFEEYPVKQLTHERIELDTDSNSPRKSFLTGPLITQHLGRAQKVIVLVCTIGSQLDEMVSSLFKTNPLAAIALDGVGSAAVESLGIQACNYLEERARLQGLNTTIPLNPGMVGWPVEQGQPELFTLLDSEQIQVSLNESCMMTPNKSLSMVLGQGEDVSPVGTACDFCSLKGVCKYQAHYAG